MCSDFLPCSCCVYILLSCRGGVGSFYCLSACCRGISACSHQSPLWHERSPPTPTPHTAVFVSPHGQTNWTWAPCSSTPPSSKPPPTVLPSLCLCKLCKYRSSSGDEAYSMAFLLTRVVSSACEQHGLPTASATPNAFLTGVSRAAWLDMVKTWG